MILFNKKENGEHFISIFVCDGTEVVTVKDKITSKFPNIAQNIYDFDNEEIIIKIPDNDDNHFDFSLNDLRKEVHNICVNVTQCFVVDISKENEAYQRVYY